MQVAFAWHTCETAREPSHEACQKFSKVRALACFLHRHPMQMAFEHVGLPRSPRRPVQYVLETLGTY